jgi:hypothetical protein
VVLAKLFPLGPGAAFGLLVGLTALAALIETFSRQRQKRSLRRLAAEWGMTYSPHERLKVVPKIAPSFPVPGAADLHVLDLIYGSKGDSYHYIFTVEFTVGVVRGKRRLSRVATFTEPRDREFRESPGPVSLAPEDLPLLEQYQKLAPVTASAKENSAAEAAEFSKQ